VSYDEKRAAAAVRELLAAVGEDPEREGLRATPDRVARAWREMLQGYQQDEESVLRTSDGATGFEDVDGYDQMIVLADYPLQSVCEHHMLPFTGRADVGYLPAEGGKVAGLSKLGRLVDLYARRLQVQERLTQQIAAALMKRLYAKGVGVRIRATHECMSCRGVRKAGVMATEALLGAFQKHPVRAEFWSLCEVHR